VLATDAHDTEKRVPILSTARDAAAAICGEQIAASLVESNPRAILNNEPLPYFPTPTTA
jgi:tyrosine-protein phosphatase YwqE